LRLKIERLAFGGRGVARAHGRVVFVEGGIPGDVVEAEIARERKGFAEARVVSLVEPSGLRVSPSCPYFGSCGGCQLQHASYDLQLRYKDETLRESLRRIGGVGEYAALSPVPSMLQYGYRTRVTLSVWITEKGCRVGFHEAGSTRMIPIDACPIAAPPVDRAIRRISKSLMAYSMSAPLERIYVATDGERAYVTLVPGWRVDPRGLNPLRDHLRRFPETECTSTIRDESTFEVTFLGIRYLLTPSTFMQANPFINERMIETVKEWAALRGGERVLDLYAGAGNISLQLAGVAGSVTGVEVSRRAVSLAVRSAEANGISNAAFLAEDAEGFCLRAATRGETYDVLVLDPPREGAKALIGSLVALKPVRVVYVSCNPTTLARDVKLICASGYRLARARAFDMFPQTYHVEAVALMERA
jgi:23S rRNA (uracil1939-C5)-methyltransferase